MAIKVLWLDSETTGLAVDNGIIQMAGLIELDSQVVESFNYRMNIFTKDKIVDAALECNGVTRQQIRTFPHPTIKFNRLVKLLREYVNHEDPNDTFILAGYNVSFDFRMLKAWFEKNDPSHDFHSLIDESSFDVLGLTRQWFKRQNIKVGKGGTVENHKLSTIARYFNIDADFHDALGDIKATREVYKIVSQP